MVHISGKLYVLFGIRGQLGIWDFVPIFPYIQLYLIKPSEYIWALAHNFFFKNELWPNFKDLVIFMEVPIFTRAIHLWNSFMLTK